MPEGEILVLEKPYYCLVDTSSYNILITISGSYCGRYMHLSFIVTIEQETQ